MEMASAEDKISTTTPQNEFSIPWDDSDLVLLFEEQQLHVHRFILKMASPVFKAMLSSDFKEKHAAEIPLPGKKADDFVVLLKQIYPQFDRRSITLDNVERIYVLADEYQIGAVSNACQDFLKSVDKTRENAMEILLKAQVCQADEARQQCCDIMKQWSLSELEDDKLFKDLDGTSARNILLPKAKRLEKYLQELLPQVFGLLGCLFVVSKQQEANNTGPYRILSECNYHQPSSRPMGFSARDIMRCKSCKISLNQLVEKFLSYRYYKNSYDSRVKKEIIELLEEICTATTPPLTRVYLD